MPPSVWHVWPSQRWPASSQQEQEFVAQLRTSLPGKSDHWNRADITCLVTHLRTGTTWTTLKANLPGLDARRLLAAYELLEHRLGVASLSWEAIVEHPSADVIAEHVKYAQLILPVPVRRIATAVTHETSDRAMRTLVGTLCRQIESTSARVTNVEETLAVLPAGTPGGEKLGKRLHHPTEESLWADPYFLPTRVGQLSPARVADLLLERRPEPGHPWESA